MCKGCPLLCVKQVLLFALISAEPELGEVQKRKSQYLKQVQQKTLHVGF